MSMNVSTTTAAYANYQNNYKTGTANKKKETAQTTENTKLKENTTESIAEKNWWRTARSTGSYSPRARYTTGSAPSTTTARTAWN